MKPTIIRCSKCGYESNIISDICIKCGSKLEKICGNCGFANDVAKNYCDQCGKLLALKINEETQEEKTNLSGNLEFENFHEAMESKDISYRKKISAQDEILREKTEGVLKEKEYLRKLEEEQKLKKEEEELKRLALEKKENFWNKKKNYVVIFLIVFIILLGSYIIFVPNIPKLTLLMTAKKYLSALRDKDYKSAYELLSNNSKLSISFTDYLKRNEEYYSKIPNWEFKDISIYRIDKNGAIIKYWLKENNEWKQDYISFILEHGKWRRPYIWNLFAPIDEAISKGDYPQALFLSQRLYLIDPVDPRTSGYLCSAEYLMGLYDKAIESCKRTIDSLSFYPVGFTQEEIFWFMFYYADSLRFQANFDKAIETYNELFKFNDISIKNKCPLLMARADAYIRKNLIDNAKDDIEQALDVCVSGINKEETLKRWRYLNGKAIDEAISFAKKFKESKQKPSLADLVKLEIDETLKKEKKKILSIEDVWTASYLDGSTYEVVIKEVKKFKNGKKIEEEKYKVKVNLWTYEAKLEKL